MNRKCRVEAWPSVSFVNYVLNGDLSDEERDRLLKEINAFHCVRYDNRNGMVIILSKKGYKYQRYDCRQTPENLADYAAKKEKYRWDDELDNVVHIASSGSQAMSLKEYEEFQLALKEGWEALEGL